MKKTILLLLAAAVLTGFSGEKKVSPEYGAVAKILARRLPQTHLLQKRFDETISATAWTNLVTSYDPDRTYFTQADLKLLAPMQLKVAEDFSKGDVKFAFQVYDLFCKRLSQRTDYIEKTLQKRFDFSIDEKLEWDRKDTAWPVDAAEQKDLWRKRLKNEYLVQTIGKELDIAAARTNKITNIATNSIIPQTAEEIILKRNKQMLTLIQDMDEETIFQRYASAVCTAYDPHTDYLSPMRQEDFEMDMNLKLVGIGAQLRSEDGMAKIMEIIPGGPADRDNRDIKLVPGDKIIGVGQGDGPIEDIVHMSLNRAVRKIRGEKGSKVVLSVIPASDPSASTAKTVDLVRDEIKLEDAAVTGRVERITQPAGKERRLGYIRVPSFYGTGGRVMNPQDPNFRSVTYDVAKRIAEYNGQNVEGFILDLRNNGGGLLPEAVQMTGLFVQSGPVVQVREANRCIPLTMMGDTVACRKPLVVLVNRFSASASEIVAGALQDYGRAIVIGDRQTHGKGTVQTVLDLGSPKYGSLKVTTASFYRITGASTQMKGVRPDIVLPSPLDSLELGEDKLPNALPWSRIDSAAFVQLSDLNLLLPELKRRSAERLAADPKYTRYVRLINAIEEYNTCKTLSLEKKAREKQMKHERATRRQLDSEEAAEDDVAAEEDLVPMRKNKEKGIDEDMVLRESARILCDYIDIAGPLVETEGDLRNRMMRIFSPR